MTSNLRSRKVDSCGLCAKWEYASTEWGYCKAIHENSGVRGANITSFTAGHDDLSDIGLETRKDFGCRLFQELDIWRA